MRQSLFQGVHHFKYHLPESRDVLHAPGTSVPREAGRQFGFCYQRKTGLVARLDASQDRALLLVVPPHEPVGTFGAHIELSGAELADESGDMLYALTTEQP